MENFFQHLLQEFQRPLSNPVLVFSLILLIILLSPILLRKLNIPATIGLIISGVIIGPNGFNILAKNAAIDLFSTIGLLYIMFIAGLELDMNDFKKNRHKSLLFGVMTFAIPIAIGFPVCYFVLQYQTNAAILIASMFATHTLVAYPIISKYGLTKNSTVAIAVGGTILTDTAVLLILAVVTGSAQGGLNEAFWIRLVSSLTIFLIIMFFIIPRVSRWFFRKLESEKTSHYIYVLAVVFFAAFLAQVAGVEPIIGAFVAGLALNRLIPHSSALMNRIEFIGNAIFIPFFLISVGMIVDVKVLLSGPTALIVAGVLTTVAIFGKWVAALLTRLILRIRGPESGFLFGLSSSHAAATLAIILVGFRAGILDENVLNGVILLILVTCIVASFATENAARKLIVSSAGENGNGQTVRDEDRILLPVGEDDSIERVIEFAALLKEKSSPYPLTVLSVVPNNEEAERNLAKARSKLDTAVKIAAASDTKITVTATIDHNIASGITRSAKESMADIIVLTWPKRPTLLDKFTGEFTDAVLSETEKHVFIVDFEKPLIMHKRIVLIVPPLAELERGFEIWLSKICKLATELSATIACHCNAKTRGAMERTISHKRLSAAITFSEFNDWEDVLVISRHVNPDDLLVFVSARKGAISFLLDLERVPAKLAKHFALNTRIVLYPRSYGSDEMYDEYEDVNHVPLTRGLATIRRIRRGIAGLFKRKPKE